MKLLYKERLKELREEQELKQHTISKLLDFHSNTYGQFEREDRIFPIKHLNTLCNYFNVSMDYIFNFTNTRKYNDSKNDIDILITSIRLKEFRKAHKLSQKQLAEILATSQANIVKYESGKNIINTIYLYDICKKYHVSADYLLGKTDSPKTYD